MEEFADVDARLLPSGTGRMFPEGGGVSRLAPQETIYGGKSCFEKPAWTPEIETCMTGSAEGVSV